MTILFEDLDDAILRGTDETRLRALNYAVDLLLSGSYNATDIATFGEVIARLAGAPQNGVIKIFKEDCQR